MPFFEGFFVMFLIEISITLVLKAEIFYNVSIRLKVHFKSIYNAKKIMR
jgi:hypothetical protein